MVNLTTILNTKCDELFKILLLEIVSEHYQIVFNGTLIVIIYLEQRISITKDKKEAVDKGQQTGGRYVKPAEIINNLVDDGLYVATFIPV